MSVILFIFWIEYVVFCYFITRIISIMSAESPTENKDYYGFGTGRSTPPPTTSYMATKLEIEGSSTSDAAALIEPKSDKDKEKDKEKDEVDKDKDEKDKDDADRPLGAGENPGYKKDECAIKDDGGNRKDDKEDRDGKDKSNEKQKMLNGDFTPDNWKLPPDGKNDEEQDEDSCIVKCLYYSMQCCECTIS